MRILSRWAQLVLHRDDDQVTDAGGCRIWSYGSHAENHADAVRNGERLALFPRQRAAGKEEQHRE